MTTTWLLIVPTPLELMLPVMPLSQPMANSALHLDSGSVVCARAVPAAPRQMMMAAIGVWLAATISHEALFALGVVLTVFSAAAVGLYSLRAKAR